MLKAAKGGQIGINGEFYKGGRFLPESIFCDQWMNGCKKAASKTFSLVKYAKKESCGAIFEKDGKIYSTSIREEEAKSAYADLCYQLNAGSISGFEWYYRDTIQRAGKEI